MKARIIFALLAMSFLSTIGLFAQSYLIPVNAPTNKYPITFTDVAQQVLVLEFDRAVLASGTSAGWTITVGGGPVAMTGSPVNAGNFLRITLASSITFANRNSVLVSYNAAVGTLSLTGPVEPNFTNVSAVNNYIAVAADFTNGLYGENPPIDICAQVINVEIEYNITVSQRYRNSIHYDVPIVWMQWEYPAATPATFADFTEIGVGTGVYRTTQNHATYPDNTINCTWDISMFPHLWNTGTLQPNLIVTQRQVIISIPNYKKDNGTPVPGTGDLGIFPPIDDPSTLFCVGENITAFTFTDATVFDCQLGVEPDLPNTNPRYVQYVYGTQVGAGIPNVFINVFGTPVQITNAAGNPMPNSWTVNPSTGAAVPAYSTQSGFFEGPVVQYLWDPGTKARITPLATTYPINHTGDYLNDMENDIFDVTLRNWGPCNPYDAMDPFTHLQAVTDISRLRLVGAPPLPTAPDVSVCVGGATTLNAVRNGANPGILHWYNNSDLLSIHEVGTGTSYNPGALGVGVYNYWVREIGTTGLLCEGPAEQVILTVVADPVAPVISKDPADGTVCAGATLSVTVSTAGSGGLGTNTDQYQYYNGSVWSAWSSSIPSFAAVTGTNMVSSRRNSTGTGCVSNINTVSWTVVADPVAPVIAKSPSDATVCAGATLTITVTTAGSGGTGTNTDQYQYSTDNGVSWSGWSTTIPSFTAVIGTNLVQSRRNSTGTGCNSNVNQVSWAVIADPIAPIIAKSPADATVCAGATLTITVTTAGSGGTGTNTDQYRYSTDNGSNWSSWGATLPSFAAVTGTNLVQSRRNSTGSGCISNVNEVSWTVVADPVAPVIAKSPADATVCAGATLTITITTAGSGGTGTNTDQYQYYNGSVWSSWSTTIPSFTAITGTNMVSSRRTSTGTGCTSNINTVTWTVVADPVAPVIAKSPNLATVCSGTTLTITVTTAGSGGTGTNTDQYQYSTDNGGTWSGWSSTIPSFPSVIGTNIVQSRRNSTGTGCNSNVNQVSWSVIAQPVAPTLLAKTPNLPAVCDGTNVSATFNAGSGGLGCSDEFQYRTHNGTVWSGWAGYTASTNISTTGRTQVEIQGRRGNCSASTGCNTTGWSLLASWNVNPLPVPTLGGPASVCIGSVGNVYTTEAGMSAYVWVVSAGGTITSGGGAGNSSVTVTWNTAGARTVSVSYTNGNGCTAATPTIYNVAVGTTPASAIITNSGDACLGAGASSMTITITGGAPPYSIKYTRNTIAQTDITGYTSGTPTSLGALAVGSYVYQITEIRDNCNNTMTVLPGSFTINIYAIPVAAAGPDQNICGSRTATLAAVPTVGTGTWTLTGVNPGTITGWGATSANNPAGTPTVSVYGTYNFMWTEVNGVCSDDDIVVVRFSENPTGASAGTAPTPACDALTATLAGTEHIYAAAPNVNSGTQTWSVIAKPDPASTVTFGNINSPTSTVTVNHYGTYTLRWTEINGNCTVTPADITFTFYERPDGASAGSAPTPVCDALNTTLAGTEHTYLAAPNVNAGTQTWSVVSKPHATSTVTFGNINSPTSTVTVNHFGSYTLRWTEVNGNCSVPTDVTFTFYERPDGASAGTAPTPVCDALTATLAGTEHTYLAAPNVNSGTQTWSVVSKPHATSTVTFGTITSPTSTVTVNHYGTYTLRWTETNGNCSFSPTDITFTFYERPDGATAGTAPTPVCDALTTTLAATEHSYAAAPNVNAGTQTWSVIAKPDATSTVTFGTITSPTSTVTVNHYGTYTLRWTEVNGNCTFSPADITFTFYEDPTAEAGTDNEINAALTYTMTAVPYSYAIAPNQNTGTHTWVMISSTTGGVVTSWGSGITTPTPTIIVDKYGEYVFRWTETNGTCSDFEEITLRFVEGANAGPDQDLCNTLSTTLAGNTPSAGTGTWTKISGSGTVNFIDGANNPLTQIVVSQYDSYVLQWTFSVGVAPFNQDQVTIDFNEMPTVNAGMNYSTCYPPAVLPALPTITLTGIIGGGATSGTWSVVANGAGSLGASTTTAPNVTATYTLDPSDAGKTITFRLTTDDPAGACPAQSDEVDVIINPLPNTSPITGDAILCTNATNKVYQVSLPRTAGSTYVWNVPAGLTVTSPAGLYFIIVDATAPTAPGAKITVTETLPGPTFCTGIPVEFPVIVTTAKPGEVVVGPSPVCEGSTLNNYSVSFTAGSTYAWSLPPGAFITTIPDNQSSVDVTFPISFSGTIDVVETNGACTTFHTGIPVTVNPRPVLSSSLTPPAICSAATFTYTATSATGGATFAWSRVGILGINGGTGSAGAANVSEVLTNTTTAPISVTYVYTTTAGGCTGNPQNVVVVVNPSGQVNDPSDMVLCNGAATPAVIFTTNNSGGSTSYAWTNSAPGIGLLASGTGNIASFTATNATTAPVVATITVTPTFTNGSVSCVGPDQTFTITVNPTAQVTDPANQVVCNNGLTSPVAFATVNTVGTTTYTWTNSASGIGLAASGAGDIAAFTASNASTAPVVATITVTPHFLNGSVTCDGPAQTFTITVNPTGQVNDPANQLVCNGAPITTVIFTSNNTGGVTTYDWTNSVPGIGLLASGTGNIASFNAINTGTSQVTATITVTPTYTNGAVSCAGPSETFTITVNPSGKVTDPADQVLCNGSNTAPVTFATTNLDGATTYSWTNTATGIGLPASGTGDIAAFAAVNTGNSPVVATIAVTPHYTNGTLTCSGTPQTFTITVNPTAQVNDPADQVVCNGDLTALVTFTTNKTGGTTTYTWTNSAPGIGLAASGTGPITAFTASNASTAPVVATITVTPHFDNGAPVCDGPAQTFTITVNPTAQVTDPADQVVCNGASTATVTFATIVTGGTTNYTWTNDLVSIGLGASGSGNIPFFTAANTTTAPVTANIEVTPHYTNGSVTCDGPPQTFTITVNPTAQVNDPANQVVCNGSPVTAVTFGTLNTGGTTTYAWTNSAPGIGLAASGTTDIASFNAINTGTSPVVATITVTPTFANGSVNCSGPAQTFTITVNPTGQVNDPADQVVCNNAPVAAINFGSVNTGGITTYAWTNSAPGIGLLASGSGNIASFTALNAGTAPIVATITVTPTFTNGAVPCAGPSESFTITINPTGQVNDPANQVVCNGGTTAGVTFATVNTIGTTTYSWTNSAPGIGLAASGTGDIAAFTASNITTAPVVATITVTPHFENGSVTCNGPVQTFTITVNPTGQVNDPADQVVCNGDLTTLVTFTTNNTGGTTTYTWTNTAPGIGLLASGSGPISAFTATNATTAPVVATITVTPHFDNGAPVCDGPAQTFTITVNPTGQVNDPADQVVCRGSSTTTVLFGTTNTGGTTTYTWVNTAPGIGLAASGSGNITAFSATNAGTAPLVATITVTPHFANGSVTCDGPTESFTITVNPTAQVNDPANQVVCNGLPVTAVNFITVNTGGATTFNWVNDNTSIGLAAGGSGNIVSFNGINTGTSPEVATIVVTPTFDNGSVTCTGPSQSFTITVNPSGQVNDPVDQVVCNGSNTASVVFTSGNSGGTTTYSWVNDNTTINLGASGTGTIPVFTATNTGVSPVVATITVTPHFTNGSVTCDGPVQTFTITVNPTAHVNDPANQVVCNGLPTTGVTFTTNNLGGTVTYNWTNNASAIGLAASGSGNIGSFNAINLGTSPVIATITVTPSFENGSVACSGPSQTFTITVNPTGQVNDPANQVVCNGSLSTPVIFTTNNTGGTTTYSWVNDNVAIGLGAGTTGNIAAFTATNATLAPIVANITVTPHYTNGSVTCDGPAETFTITVNPSGNVADPADQALCNGETTNLVTFTTGNTGGTTTYSWTNSATGIGLAASGTGDIAAFTASNITSAPVVATITVTPHFTNGSVTCNGPVQTFTITVNPAAQVNDPANETVCAGDMTTAVVFGTLNSGGTTTYNWTNDNATIGLAALGTGDIASFAAINAGTAPVTATITVIPTFTNGAVSCPGPAQAFTITVNPAGQVNDPSDQVVCAGSSTATVLFGTLNTGGSTTYSWTNDLPSIGLAASGTGSIPFFTATNASTAPVVATIEVTPHYTNNSVTCDGTPETFTITVNPKGQVNDPANQVVCNGLPVTAVTFTTNNTGGTTTYTWVNNTPSIGLAVSGTGPIASFNAINTGNFPVTATITVTPHYDNGLPICDGTAQTFTITVNPTGQVNDPADQVVCNGGPVSAINFSTNNLGGTTTYSWINSAPGMGLAASGTGNIATFNAINLGTLPIVATVTVTPHFLNGAVTCDGPVETFTITVNPTAQVDDPADQVVCNGSPTTLVTFGTLNTGGTTTYTWTNSASGIGLAASGSGDIASFTAVNTGTTPIVASIVVTPHFENGSVTCNGPAQTFTITVNPTAQVNDPANLVVCNTDNVSVTFTTGNSGGVTTYAWTNTATGIGLAASGTGSIASFAATNATTAPITATITVTPTFTNGVACVGPDQTFTITVNPTGQVTDPADQVVCNGSFTAPVNFVTVNTGGTTSYTWTNSETSIGLAAAGTGNISAFPAVNTGTSPVTATITVTPHFSNNLVTCDGPVQTFTITVNPTAQVTDPADQVVCNGAPVTAITFATVNTVGTTTYSWTNSATGMGLAASGSGNIAAFTASNASTAPIVATITVTPTFNNGSVNCTGPAQTFTITVNPTGQVNDPANQVVCNGASATGINFATSNTGGTTTYDWVNDSPSIGLAAAGSGNIAAFTAVNSGVTPVVATITVTPHFANASVTCTGPSETFTITVNPTPNVSTASPLTICSATTTNIALTSNIAGTTYTWTVGAVTGGITGASASSGSTIAQILINPGTAPGSVTYAVTPAAGGCSGLPVNITVAVNPTPNVSTLGSTTICSATSTNIALSSSVAGTTFTWTIGTITGGVTGATPAGGSNIAQILTNPGTTAGTVEYIVTPIANTCPGIPVSVVITVNPTPDVTTASVTTICSSATTNIALTSGVAGTTFSWTIGGVTGSVSGATASNGTTIAQTLYNTGLTPGTVTYIVTPTANSCSGLPTNIVVTVNPSTGPTSFTTGPLEVCQDGPDETYTATATNSTSILYSVLPAAAGTINATTGIMDWDPAYYGNATITATSAGLCGTTVGTVTVRVKRLPSIAASPVAAVTCEFGQVNFDVTANGDDLSYQWEVDPNTGTFATVSGGIYSGIASSTLQIWSADRTMNNYKYRVVVSGCLPDVTSASALLTVNTAPELTVHPKDSIICLGAGTTMNAAALGTGITWTWYVNKGVGGFVPVVADTHFSFATTISSDTTKTTLTITDALSTYNNWIFRAQAKGTCGAAVNTNFARLSVTNPPTVALQPVPKVICENGSTSFLGNGSGYLNLQWQLSTNAGATWTNITDDAVTYVGASTNQLSILNAPVTLNSNQYRLAFIGACTTVYSNGVTLTVNPNPIVNFVADVNACGGVPLVLNGNPSGGTLPYAQHRWTGDVGPLSLYTVQSPTFNSQISGTYTLNYKVTDSKGCTANDDLVVIVDSPSAEFTQDIDNGCTPLTVNFTKDMTGIAKFWWDFNDGTPLDSLRASPDHNFVNSSKTAISYHNVKLKVQSPGGCIKTYTSLVTVYPAVKATFTATADTICSGKTVTFTGISGASKYFWEYGDAVSAYAGSNSTHLYINSGATPLDLNVKLTTTSFYNCNADTTIKIVVMPVPVAQFEADSVSQVYKESGNPVSFTNLTNAGNWTYLWNFDDGTTSTATSPSHSFADLGDYDVTLEVTNGSCTDKVMHTISVTPKRPVAKFDSIPPACEPLSVTFNNTSDNTEIPGTTYFWEFGDGGISTAKNPEYTYFDPGIYVVKLTVRGPGGNDDATRTVYVNPSPKAYFEVAPLFVFVNDEKVRGFNLSQGADYYVWDFGDGDTSHVKEPFHKYMEPGVFDITLSAYSNNGCYDKYILSPGVTVEPAGDIRFSTVFTPNKDGEIDGDMGNINSGNMDMFFYPPIQEKVQKYKLQIFNRLGVLLFESRSINKAWNGYYKGKLCPQGVYIWYVEGKYSNGEPFKKVGDVTLLH